MTLALLVRVQTGDVKKKPQHSFEYRTEKPKIIQEFTLFNGRRCP